MVGDGQECTPHDWTHKIENAEKPQNYTTTMTCLSANLALGRPFRTATTAMNTSQNVTLYHSASEKIARIVLGEFGPVASSPPDCRRSKTVSGCSTTEQEGPFNDTISNDSAPIAIMTMTMTMP
jgi:hypothetical protein